MDCDRIRDHHLAQYIRLGMGIDHGSFLFNCIVHCDGRPADGDLFCDG